MFELLILTTMVSLSDEPEPPVPTDRDRRAVAMHALEEAGLAETSSRHVLYPALVDREVDLRALRNRVADMEIQLDQLRAQVIEMQAFVLDHDRYGSDFTQYQLVREEAQREARRREALERRARRELAQQQQQEARARQEAERQLGAPGKDLKKTLQTMNFGHLGQEVWRSRAAYHYAVVDRPGETVTYRPSPFGGTRVVTEHEKELDWSEMTISGSLLNAAEATRNIGIAVAFFDEHGNQIGAETIVVKNARPGVPYPFTQTLDMAANKPFASDTAWVLFADPITTATAPATP